MIRNQIEQGNGKVKTLLLFLLSPLLSLKESTDTLIFYFCILLILFTERKEIVHGESLAAQSPSSRRERKA